MLANNPPSRVYPVKSHVEATRALESGLQDFINQPSAPNKQKLFSLMREYFIVWMQVEAAAANREHADLLAEIMYHD